MKKKEHSRDFIRATLSFHEISGNSVEKTAHTFDVEQETLVSWIEEHEQETIPFVRGEYAELEDPSGGCGTMCFVSITAVSGTTASAGRLRR